MGFFKSIFESTANVAKSLSKFPRAPETPKENLEIEETSLKQNFITIPSRQSNSFTGNQFANLIYNIGSGAKRENIIFAEMQKGNVPNFLREPVEITIVNGGNVLNYFVFPDVLCVGTNQDFLRVSIDCHTAQKVADLFNCVLPTKKMADQIWEHGTVKLTPQAGGPPYDISMTQTPKFVEHHNLIEKQRAGREGLIVGHKKDYVLTKHLFTYPNNCAIYGWFNQNGIPIQGLNSKDHDRFWVDYSQSPRLIGKIMYLNGQKVDFYDILNNQDLANLISDEGPFDAIKMYK